MNPALTLLVTCLDYAASIFIELLMVVSKEQFAKVKAFLGDT